MPKIDAPTLAEHHARRRASLVQAATDLLATGSADAVNLATVGAAAGLARSSVYQYFDSTSDLLAAVVEEAFPPANAALVAAVSRVDGPAPKVEAYVRAYLRAATDETHRSMSTLANADLPRQSRDRIAELHTAQLAPLAQALSELGVRQPALTASLIAGTLSAASASINAGARRTEVTRTALALIRHGILGDPSTAPADS